MDGLKKDVLVTVIMTCYNHEKYVRTALESVMRQKTNFKFKVIVHDDASKDGSVAIIKEFEERYPDVICAIYQKENQFSKGVSIRRTFIDPHLEGKYIAYCECDDYWLDENKLQIQVDFLEKNPCYSATAHNCIYVDADGNTIPPVYDCYPREKERVYTLFDNALDYRYPGQTATVVYRREAFCFSGEEQKNDYYYGMRMRVGDAKRNLHLLVWGDMFCFAQNMSAYRVVLSQGDSWSARNYEKNLYLESYTSSIDQRAYVWKYYKKIYPNYFTTFRKGVKGIIVYLKTPTDENKRVFDGLCADKGGIVPLLIYLLGIGILAVPFYFIRRCAIGKMKKNLQ